MTLVTAAPAPAFEPAQRPVWHMAVESFLPPRLRRAADAFIARLPIIAILLIQAGVTLRLSNTAFEDEGLYIDAGHDYIAGMVHGVPLPIDYGSFFSGVPTVYPVWAAMLDYVGGLELVRAFSLACMMIASLCIWAVGKHLWGSKTGLFGAFLFVATGPVQFVGDFATFDAPCLGCLAVVMWLGVTKRSYWLSLPMGLLLGLAVALKYTGAIFVPIVLAIVFLARPDRRQLIRTVLSSVALAGFVVSLYLLLGSSIKQGILFTTASRKALSPAPATQLLSYALRDIGPIFVLAVLGSVVLVRARHRRFWLVAAFAAGAVVLPAGQLRIGEAVSFEKHLSYSALFLAPLAGAAIAALTKKVIGIALIFLVIYVASSDGLSRSQNMYLWPNVSPVMKVIEANPTPGAYLSSSSRPLGYYTRNKYPDIVWHDQYALFSSPLPVMQQAITNRTYQMYIFSTGTSGNPVADRRTASFIAMLQKSPNYALAMSPFPVRKYSVDKWLVYRLVTPAAK
jgi:hypothetical protein